MKRFPDTLHVKNKKNFSKINYERVKCYLRRDLYDHIIRYEEKDYFELDRFDKERLNDVNLMEKMTKELIVELEKLGWTCNTSYGKTGLFIYHGDPPPNYFPDGLV